jgi:hypothetical protein
VPTDGVQTNVSKTKLFISVDNNWLGIVNLFQTFGELDNIKDKQADTKEIRALFHADNPKNKK